MSLLATFCAKGRIGSCSFHVCLPICCMLLYFLSSSYHSIYSFCTNSYANLFCLVCLPAHCILYCTNSLHQFLLCCMFFFLCGEDPKLAECATVQPLCYSCALKPYIKKKKKKKIGGGGRVSP